MAPDPEAPMTDAAKQSRQPELVWRWLTWCVCLALWTTVLLTSFPVQVGAKVLSPGLRFPTAKALHVSAYAFLAALITWLPIPTSRRWLVLAFLSLHGFATEYLQQFVPGRVGSWRDVGLDHLGIALGVALTWRGWLSRPRP
jgi:VanZ family protein